jgi:hypothetical protein
MSIPSRTFIIQAYIQSENHCFRVVNAFNPWQAVAALTNYVDNGLHQENQPAYVSGEYSFHLDDGRECRINLEILNVEEVVEGQMNRAWVENVLQSMAWFRDEYDDTVLSEIDALSALNTGLTFQQEMLNHPELDPYVRPLLIKNREKDDYPPWWGEGSRFYNLLPRVVS